VKLFCSLFAVVVFLFWLFPAHSQQTSKPPLRPVTWVEVVSLLIKNVPQENIASLLNERSLGFPASAHFIEPLQEAGAKEPLLEAIRRAGQSVKENFQPSQMEVSEAEQTLRDALRTQANNALLHHLLGVILGYKANLSDPRVAGKIWGDAIREIRESIKISPDNYLAHYDLAPLLENKFPPDRNGVISEYRKVVALKPDWAQGYAALGSALWWKRDWAGRVAAYQSAVRLDPSNPEYHHNLGNAFSDMQDFEASRREYLEALRLDPKDDASISGLYQIGIKKYERGDVDGAIVLYSDVLKLKPDDAACYFRLGEALLRKGNKAASEDAFRRACELNPKSSTFRWKCEELSR